MQIRRYDTGLLCSNMYVIEENGHAAVIDPGRDTSPAAGLTVDWILLTHEHYDHISGVTAWQAATGARVLCSAACAARIADPRTNMARLFPVFCEMQRWVKLDRIPDADTEFACHADETFTDETELFWQGHRFYLAETPGHSPGSIMILLDDAALFSGDSLLRHAAVELRFPGGSRKQWQETGGKRFGALPPGLHVWPGHFEDFIDTPEERRQREGMVK